MTLSGTKIKQRYKLEARSSKRVARVGSTKPAMRATRENLSKFAKGQKLRSDEPMAERYAASIVRGSARARPLTPRARLKALSEALKASGDDTSLSTKGPATNPEARRKRTWLRQNDMRYVRQVEPGLNINPPGKWIDAAPLIGTARIRWYRWNNEPWPTREIVSVGRANGMTSPAGQ